MIAHLELNERGQWSRYGIEHERREEAIVGVVAQLAQAVESVEAVLIPNFREEVGSVRCALDAERCDPVDSPMQSHM